jgi:hypothetical protein
MCQKRHRKAHLLLNIEPELDRNKHAALAAAMAQAEALVNRIQI